MLSQRNSSWNYQWAQGVRCLCLGSECSCYSSLQLPARQQVQAFGSLTHTGDADGVSSSGLWSGPVLAIIGICRVEPVNERALFLSAFWINEKKNSFKEITKTVNSFLKFLKGIIWDAKHQQDQHSFHNEIIYYLLMVEQHRSLHIHSKNSLKHVSF